MWKTMHFFMTHTHVWWGGLVDMWKSVNEIHGHIETGMALRREKIPEGYVAGDAVCVSESQMVGGGAFGSSNYMSVDAQEYKGFSVK